MLDTPLMRNDSYGVVVIARGYKPTTYDEVAIGEETDDPTRWSIKMVK